MTLKALRANEGEALMEELKEETKAQYLESILHGKNIYLMSFQFGVRRIQSQRRHVNKLLNTCNFHLPN